jgi:Tol biopolymer transport system component
VHQSRASGAFTVSANGVLAYRGGSGDTLLSWFDRNGKPVGMAGPPGEYIDVSLSPDGTRVAASRVDAQGGHTDIWLMDVDRGAPTRFTDDPANDEYPVWSPDGSSLIFGSMRTGLGDLHRKSAGGIGQEQPLLKTSLMKRPYDWSADGRFLL